MLPIDALALPDLPWTLWAYAALLLAVVGERVAELVVSRRNAAWSMARGGREFGRGHFPFMVALHTAFLAGCLLEPWLLERPFLPWLGAPMLALAIGAQALRWWAIATLGHRWNTRVIVVPDLPLVRSGPYRWLRHPNYAAVVVEGFALPLIHTGWLTALLFTLLNAVVLAGLAGAPAPPAEVQIAGAVQPSTTLSWDRPDAAENPQLAGYRVHWRLTTEPQWQWSVFVPDNGEERQEYTLENVVIDNYLFGVSSVARDGSESPVVFPGVIGDFTYEPAE